MSKAVVIALELDEEGFRELVALFNEAVDAHAESIVFRGTEIPMDAANTIIDAVAEMLKSERQKEQHHERIH